MIVVIPSNRTINLDYLRPLIEAGARFIVIDDSDGTIKIDHPRFEVYNWSDRKRVLGKHDIAIARRNGACRTMGFYLAWRESDNDEIIIALDDDCEIEQQHFAEQVRVTLEPRERVIAQGDGKHFNIFDLYKDLNSSPIFPRGFPYSQRVSYQPWNLRKTVTLKADFNLGLWRGAFDINAIDKLHLTQTFFPDAELRQESVVVPSGALISVCAGSMHFRRKLIPAVYQLPMNIPIMAHWNLDRYGDIWGGFILKKLMDARGNVISVGAPLVHHLREAPYQGNLAKELMGQLVNDEFILLLEQSCDNLRPASYLEMMSHLLEEFRRRSEKASPILGLYLKHLDATLEAWLSLLQKA